MDQGRLNRIIESMKAEDMYQMIITDPVSIFYLTKAWILPGERMLALYINVDGETEIVVNKLFP